MRIRRGTAQRDFLGSKHDPQRWKAKESQVFRIRVSLSASGLYQGTEKIPDLRQPGEAAYIFYFLRVARPETGIECILTLPCGGK